MRISTTAERTYAMYVCFFPSRRIHSLCSLVSAIGVDANDRYAY